LTDVAPSLIEQNLKENDVFGYVHWSRLKTCGLSISGDDRLNNVAVECERVSSSNHVTPDNNTRLDVKAALFEDVFIQTGADVLTYRGVWLEEGDKLDNSLLKDWLFVSSFGVEERARMGRLRCYGWQAKANTRCRINARWAPR
jgi:hypothetical protein